MKIPRTIDRYFAMVILFGSITLSVAAWALGSRYVLLAIFGTAIAMAYLVLAGRPSGDVSYGGSKRFLYTSSLAFFVLLTISVLFLRAERDPYERSFLHFATAALMFGVVSVQAISVGKRPYAGTAVLCEIIVVSYWVRIAPQLVFPGVIAIDSWFHLGVVQRIIDSGFVPTDTVYSGIAQFHILAASFAILSGPQGLSYLEFLSSGLATIGAVFIFLIARNLFNNRVGLLAAAAYGFASYLVVLGFSFVASGPGATILLLTFYLYIKYSRRKTTIILIPLVLLMVALIHIHTIMALTLLIVMLALKLWERFRVLFRFVGESAPHTRSDFLWVFFGVTMLAWWGYVSGHLVNLAELMRWGFRYEPWSLSDASLSYRAGVSSIEYLLNLSGLLALVALAFLGSLWLVSSSRVASESMGVIVVVWVLGLLGLVSIVFNLSGFLGVRWILAFEVFAAPLVGVGLLSIIRSSTHRGRALLAVFLVATLAAFGNLASPSGNYDTNVYSPNTHVRLAFSDQELASLGRIGSWQAPTVLVIYPEYTYFLLFVRVRTLDVGPFLVERSLEDVPEGLIVLRSEVADSPIYFTRTLIRLPYDPILTLSSTHNLVYDSGEVFAFSTHG